MVETFRRVPPKIVVSYWIIQYKNLLMKFGRFFQYSETLSNKSLSSDQEDGRPIPLPA